MRLSIAALITLSVMTTAHAETINFDRDEVGKVPAGWTAGVTDVALHIGRWRLTRLHRANRMCLSKLDKELFPGASKRTSRLRTGSWK